MQVSYYNIDILSESGGISATEFPSGSVIVENKTV